VLLAACCDRNGDGCGNVIISPRLLAGVFDVSREVRTPHY
jgi:hypothetical protein